MADRTRPRGRRVTRRELLHGSARAGAGAFAAWFLAACGIESQRRERGDRVGELPPLAHQLRIAHWPLYIDKKTVPSFEAETGIDVQYREIIGDNQEFFATLQFSLSQGETTGWDLTALSDWVVARMNRLGWLEPLDHSLLPAVDANIGEEFRDPTYDPGNAHSVPWQGGVTGIGYNPELTGRTLSAFEELWDPEFAGHVGMLSEMVDTMNLTLLSMGIDPLQATVEDAERAQQRLIEQREAGIVRGYYGNDYIDGLARGDLWATMAWSGDIFWLKADHPELEFVVPAEGGIRWVTPMQIPLGAAHPRDAHAFLDYVYDPEIAANITEWVGYISPVASVPEVLLQRAASAQGDGAKRFLEDLATNPLVFPTPELAADLHTYKILSGEEERAWFDLFDQVVT
ncbi:MAG: spermidine/putrescine ABC transporter substrate-binding protein [Actinomycetota bacterium]|nr:spermidine/putrescine ABC transporter substrate-binding protein [Actinomycetota bacterium]